MTQTSAVENPFMLMLNPEVVIAAMERSERLSQLNRHLCRPLDRPTLAGVKPVDEDEATDEIHVGGDAGIDTAD
jgi:hypothetical protein